MARDTTSRPSSLFTYRFYARRTPGDEKPSVWCGDIYTTWGYDGGEPLPWTIARAALAAAEAGQAAEEQTR